MKKLMVIGLVLLMGVAAFAGDDEMKKDEGMMDEMPAMNGMTGAPMVWFEIGATDVAATREFYKNLFNFKMDPMEGMEDYYGFSHMGEDEGGLMGAEAPYVTVYFAVENVSESLKKAEELGGAIVIPETPLGEGGASFGLFTDLEGNHIGLWSSNDSMMEDDGMEGEMDHEMDEEMDEK